MVSSSQVVDKQRQKGDDWLNNSQVVASSGRVVAKKRPNSGRIVVVIGQTVVGIGRVMAEERPNSGRVMDNGRQWSDNPQWSDGNRVAAKW